MKKTLLTLMVLCASFLYVFAQTEKHGACTTFSQHEFRLGIGDPLLHIHHVNNLYSTSLSFSNMFQAPDYDGSFLTTLPITFGYRYRPLRWLWIGGDITYYHFSAKANPGSLKESISTQLFSLDFAMRFSYLNREKVTLYSELTYNLLCFHPNMSRMSAHCTLIGVTAGGRHWFGSAELGYGYKGLLNIGFGYRL